MIKHSAALALCALIIMGLAPNHAEAEFSREVRACRSALAKSGAKLTKAGIASSMTCYAQRIAGKRAGDSPCSDPAAADLRGKYVREVERLAQTLADGSSRCGGLSPAAIGFGGSCPAPCENPVTTLGDVKNCTQCLVEAHIGAVATEALGSAELPASSANQTCIIGASKALAKLYAGVVKETTKCQFRAEGDGAEDATACIIDGFPSAKSVRFASKAHARVTKPCGSADFSTLAACASNVVSFAGCVRSLGLDYARRSSAAFLGTPVLWPTTTTSTTSTTSTSSTTTSTSTTSTTTSSTTTTTMAPPTTTSTTSTSTTSTTEAPPTTTTSTSTTSTTSTTTTTMPPTTTTSTTSTSTTSTTSTTTTTLFVPPTRIAAAGDSITQAFAADCDCNLGITCLACLIGGDQPEHSWFDGNSGNVYSVHDRYKETWPSITSNKSASEDGSEMRGSGNNFSKQADTILALSPLPDHVEVELGGNDICNRGCTDSFNCNDTLYTDAQWRSSVRAGLDKLVAGLPLGSTIYFGGVPRVHDLRAAGLAKQQGVSNIACETVWSTFNVCEIATAGGNYNGESTATRYAGIAARQIRYNEILVEEAAAYNANVDGRNPRGIEVVTDYQGEGVLSIGTFSFQKEHIDGGDCFHPSVLGQNVAAELAWTANPDR